MVQGICDQADCKVKEDGLCVEGLPLLPSDGRVACPHFTPTGVQKPVASNTAEQDEEAEDDEDFDESSEPTRSTPIVIRLPHGESLSLSEISQITYARLAKLIVLAGDSDSGKTTILASLHERFQEGLFGGWCFSNSRTLSAFERICFDSRATSGREHPVTLHTPASEDAHFFHLRLKACDEYDLLPKRAVDLLISNISGEVFERLRDNRNEAMKYPYLRRADRIGLVLDGGKLGDLSERHHATGSTRQLLRRLIEVGYVGSWTCVDFIITKIDLLTSPPEGATASAEKNLQYLEITKNILRDNYSSVLGDIRFHEIAARPRPESRVQEGLGMDHLLNSWANESLMLNQSWLSRKPSNITKRESARFQWPNS